MRNAIMAEFLKIRKNKIFLVCSLVVLLSAVFIVIKDLFFINAPEDPIDWLMGNYMVTAIFLPIMSGFIITFLVQREYEDRTIINVLTAPTSRAVFIFSKLIVWFLWYLIVLVITGAIYTIGGFLIYPNQFGFAGAKILMMTLLKYRLLGFAASIPLLWIAIKQKRMFYPTIMAALVFTGLELAALNMPLQIASIIPWSAAVLLSLFNLPNPYMLKSIISILFMGIAGIILAYVSFQKQDQ